MENLRLLEKSCKPCEGGVPKLNSSEIQAYNSILKSPWNVVDEMKITKEFHFKSYMQTLNFVNRIGQLAEKEGHHPVMHVYFVKLQVELWTHAILGLSENDFILAAKIDQLAEL